MDELFGERRRGADESRPNLSTHNLFDVTPTSFASFVRRHAAVFRGEAPVSRLTVTGWQPSSAAR
jgi:hypothetical protein